VTTVDFSADQQQALDAILEWRAGRPRGENQYLTFGGYAGTGKTTLVSHLTGEWEGTATAAFCGKAANVLRSKGVDATTIHGLIYVPLRTHGNHVRYVLRSSLPGVRTIIVDEASMVDHVLLQHLLSFRLPVLFVGDHGQLEPIGTNPRLMEAPHVRLETIHRQDRENPIISLATAFREGRPAQRWQDPRGRLSVLGRSEFHRLVSPDTQMICGVNETRHRVNKRVRELLRFGDRLVAVGEKLICLRNNRDWQIFNGQQMRVLDIGHETGSTIDLDVETDDGRTLTLPCLREQFGKKPVERFWSEGVALMDYGYCVTAHKAQGSEWPYVLILEEISSKWDARRWRYTAATRASQRLTYCA
jgi:exodeoxyribonuclease-5